MAIGTGPSWWSPWRWPVPSPATPAATTLTMAVEKCVEVLLCLYCCFSRFVGSAESASSLELEPLLHLMLGGFALFLYLFSYSYSLVMVDTLDNWFWSLRGN